MARWFKRKKQNDELDRKVKQKPYTAEQRQKDAEKLDQQMLEANCGFTEIKMVRDGYSSTGAGDEAIYGKYSSGALAAQEKRFRPDQKEHDDYNFNKDEQGTFAPVSTIDQMHGLPEREDTLKHLDLAQQVYTNLIEQGLIQRWREVSGIDITPDNLAQYCALREAFADDPIASHRHYSQQWKNPDYDRSNPAHARSRALGRKQIEALLGEEQVAPQIVGRSCVR